ncbi:MAG: hypothetical protein GWP10_14205 [Nitrospiraceae bacterium]|nr:hypothetical protein [Nitrospiraceae bacterium]
MKPNLDAKPEVFAAGFISPEGPAFNPEGVLFLCDFGVEPPTGDASEAKDRNVYRVSPQREVEVFVNTGGSPTGAAFHRDGRLFICDSGRKEILSLDPDGGITVLASAYQGEGLKGPNDLCFDLQGNLYFTDPGSSNPNNRIGDVYSYRSDGQLIKLDTGYAMCNGIAIGPDAKTLYIDETYTRRIYRFELRTDGTLGKRTLFAELAGGFGPDGMAFDAAGNLYLAHWGKGCVAILSAEGKLIGELPVIGMNPTNVAFLDDTLYVTEAEKGQIIRFKTGISGLELYNSRT